MMWEPFLRYIIRLYLSDAKAPLLFPAILPRSQVALGNEEENSLGSVDIEITAL
jgi:hypothetical protein